MNGIGVLTASLESSTKVAEFFIADLSDADLMVRPVPEANHFAWQLGHLIAAERAIVLEQLPNAAMPELPAGFAEAHSTATAASDDPKAFWTRDEYIALMSKVRAATLAELAKLTDSDLDRATVGNLAGSFPKLGSVFGMLTDHIMMHLGQVTVVRRKLGKPVLF